MTDANRDQGQTGRKVNVYREWLNIPRDEQPPHHYRLLDLDPFESDPGVITRAAERRREQLETHLDGRHKETARKLWRQIVASRDCLLNAETKAAYDRELRAKLQPQTDGDVPFIDTSAEPGVSRRYQSRRKRRQGVSAAVALGLTAAVFLAVMTTAVLLWPGHDQGDREPGETVAQNGASKDASRPLPDRPSLDPTTSETSEPPIGSQKESQQTLPASSPDSGDETLSANGSPRKLEREPGEDGGTRSHDAKQQSASEADNPQTPSAAETEPSKDSAPVEPVVPPSAVTRIDDPKEFLAKRGLRVLPRELMLDNEPELSRMLKEIDDFRSKLFDAHRDWANLQRAVDGNDRQVVALKRREVQLNAQLANLNPNNVILNNKLVGALNAIQGQTQLLLKNREQLSKQVEDARKEVVQARENYIGHVLKTRKRADHIEQTYQTLSADNAVPKAVALLNADRDENQKYRLEVSSVFRRNVHRLEGHEKSVLSDSVALRRTQGDSLYVSVVIDGKHTHEMIVDSGASLISLPYKVAVASGLEPKDTDPTIILTQADGQPISAKRITIPSVRVGKFTVENVDAAVLGPEAAYAEPLLGMSFLGNFKVEIDADATKLRLLQVEAENKSASRGK